MEIQGGIQESKEKFSFKINFLYVSEHYIFESMTDNNVYLIFNKIIVRVQVNGIVGILFTQ